MAPNDVVKHDLNPSKARFALERAKPMPDPSVSGSPRTRMDDDHDPPETTRVVDLTKHPYRSVGKLFIKGPGPDDAYGASGWVVATQAIITAAHVVYNKKLLGGWAEAEQFYPRYVPQSTYGFVAKTLYTLQGWIDTKDQRYDLGAIVMTKAFNDSEPPLAWLLDSEPFEYLSIGYPIIPLEQYPFNGERMWQCKGEAIQRGDGIEWAVSNLTEGASGGPWCNPEEDGLPVVGITGSGRISDPDVACSPIFGEGFRNLYDAVKNA